MKGLGKPGDYTLGAKWYDFGMENCFICQRIDQIKAGTNPYFVRELKTGYVVLCDFQLFEGYTLFLGKTHVKELHHLPGDTREVFLHEMAVVAEAVCAAFQPLKLNYELLGNTDQHVHWHLIPRFGTDPDPKMPIWSLGKEVLADDKNRPTPARLAELKRALSVELDKLLA